jgi:uncharacterized membrane-anchored protein YhcB (DUF1043 family)
MPWWVALLAVIVGLIAGNIIVGLNGESEEVMIARIWRKRVEDICEKRKGEEK